MSKAWEWMKAHPWASAGIVFVLGLVIVMLFFRRGPTAVADDGSAQYAASAANAAASGNDLMAMEAQLQAAGQSINAGVAQNENNNASAVALAQIAANAASDSAAIQAAAAQDVAMYGFKTAEVTSTMAAQVASRQAQSLLIEKMYTQLASPVTSDTAGAFISGNYDIASGAFNIRTESRPYDDVGNPYTMVQGGITYGLRYAANGGALPQNAIQGKAGSYYIPIQQSASIGATVMPGNDMVH